MELNEFLTTKQLNQCRDVQFCLNVGSDASESESPVPYTNVYFEKTTVSALCV